MNSVLNMFGGVGNNGVGGNAIMMQAIGAMLRGESAQSFAKRLANSYPEMKKMNLDDLWGSAQKLAQERGVNADELAKQLESQITPMLK